MSRLDEIVRFVDYCKANGRAVVLSQADARDLVDAALWARQWRVEHDEGAVTKATVAEVKDALDRLEAD